MASGQKTLYVQRPDIWRRAQVVARALDGSLSHVVEEMLIEYLDRNVQVEELLKASRITPTTSGGYEHE